MRRVRFVYTCGHDRYLQSNCRAAVVKRDVGCGHCWQSGYEKRLARGRGPTTPEALVTAYWNLMDGVREVIRTRPPSLME
jgi:hypothetical protein